MKSAIFFLLCVSQPALCDELIPWAGAGPEQFSVLTSSQEGTAPKYPGSTKLDPFNPYSTATTAPAADPPAGMNSVITLPLPAGSTATTDFGFFGGGAVLQILVSGTVDLGPTGTTTNPDGSLGWPMAATACEGCWAPGYQYFIPGASYPDAAGGDGVNHFLGGGGNYDVHYGNHSPWAPEGVATTDTTDPGAIRFGEVAGTFSSHPAPNSLDWFAVGTGGTFQVPDGGAHLYLVVPDAYYANNSGAYSVKVNLAPEPGSLALLVLGLALLGSIAYRSFRVDRCNSRSVSDRCDDENCCAAARR